MEMLIAVAISGIILGGVSSAVVQVITVKALSSNITIAVKQVENAFHHLAKDVQMSQNITDPAELGETEWLAFEWKWSDEAYPYYRVAYEIEDDELYRHQTISELWHGTPEEDSRIRVAEYIDAGELYWELLENEYDEGTLKVTIAAAFGEYKPAIETRIINVSPRIIPASTKG